MAFWQEGFLNKIRAEWLRRLDKFQYQAGGIWRDAQITEKTIIGNTVRIKTVTTDNLSLTITSARILDPSGDVAGQISENITKTSTQGLLTLWEFPLYEIT
jgi:hypothetical protein